MMRGIENFGDEGVESSKDPAAARRVLEDFLRLAQVLPLSREIVVLFGKEATRLRRTGRAIPDFGIVIAATALHHGLTLCTEDRKHFDRFENLNVVSLGT